jgi:hypothetical protein
MDAVREAAPVDGREVVEWMHYAACDNAAFDGMCEDYNRLGGKLISGSGDPYQPGVSVGDLKGVSETGSVVRSRGYGMVDTPYGRFRVPAGGKTVIAARDILGWGAIPEIGIAPLQWILSLLQWLDLAKPPIRQRVRFASSFGMVAPNFFSIPSTLAPVRTLRIGLTSDKPQTMVIKGRGAKGSYENVLFEDKFDVEAGENEVIYNVFGIPFVGAFTLELQPSDNTEAVLDYIEIFPPV